MKRFGEKKWGPECMEVVPTPEGQPCMYCEEPIAATDNGLMMPTVMLSQNQVQEFPLHRECFLRGVYGSVGHQMGKCHCRGGTVEDPEGMTKRQAAIAAVEYMESVGPFRATQEV